MVLKQIAVTLNKAARGDEPVYRIGGEEFLVLCPNSTAAEAEIGTERLRQAVETNAIRFDTLELTGTVSVGVAESVSGRSKPAA